MRWFDFGLFRMARFLQYVYNVFIGALQWLRFAITVQRFRLTIAPERLRCRVRFITNLG